MDNTFGNTIVGYTVKEQPVPVLEVLIGMLHILFPYGKKPRVTSPKTGTSPSARDGRGNGCSPLSTRARRYTLLGAWEKSLFDSGLSLAQANIKAESIFDMHIDPFTLAEYQGVADEEWTRTVLMQAITHCRKEVSHNRWKREVAGRNSQGELTEYTREVEC